MPQTDRSFLLLFPLVATLLLNAAHAATTFNNREHWEAAAGLPVTVIDFSTRDDGTPISTEFFNVTSLTLRGVTFTPTSGTFRLQFHSLIFGSQRPLRAALPANTTAVGINLSSVSRSSTPYKVDLSTGETYAVEPTVGSSSQIFFGITSTTPLEWISIYQHSGNTKVDNFAFVVGSALSQPSSGNPLPENRPGAIDSTTSPTTTRKQ